MKSKSFLIFLGKRKKMFKTKILQIIKNKSFFDIFSKKKSKILQIIKKSFWTFFVIF